MTSYKLEPPSESATRNWHRYIAALIIGCVLVLSLSGSHSQDLDGFIDYITSGSNGICSTRNCFIKSGCVGDTFSRARVWANEGLNIDNKHDTAILIVGHAPSKVAMDHILSMADSCRKGGHSIHVWVSLDDTYSHNSTHAFISALKEHSSRLIIGRDIMLHEFTGEQAHQRYPVLNQVPYCRWKSNRNSLLRASNREYQSITQIESIMMWWKHERVVEQEYKFVWVFDDNVGFSGNITDLVSLHEPLTDDLVTFDGCNNDENIKFTTKYSPSGTLGKLTSPEFNQFLKSIKSTPMFSEEHVQRYSAKLLNELNTCSLHGITADRRRFACSIASASGFKTTAINEDMIGAPFSIGDKPSNTDWEEIDSLSRTGKPKLYFPVK